MNEKRRQSFRVTHLFSLDKDGAGRGKRGPASGPKASGAAPVLTLTTVYLFYAA